MVLKLQQNRFLSEFSTFGIGGPIRYLVEVTTYEEMEEAFSLNIPFMIIGKGSNSLFDDRGFDGLAILNKIDFCNLSETHVSVGAGYSFSLLGVQTARKGLSGLEFASGIPATVGGAIFMNAGANGKETCESLSSVLYMKKDGTKENFLKEELTFSYRSSPFQKMNGAILSATFTLTPLEDARKRQLEIVERRMKTQPLKDKSAGCIFRNPSTDISAGALIDQCGLKGLTIGGAQVSPIHANFLINAGSATSKEMRSLIQLVQEKVFEQTGIHLETEIWLSDDPK